MVHTPDGTDGLLAVWHAYRLPLLFALSALIIALRSYRKSHSRAKTPASVSVPSSPRSSSPEKKIIETPVEQPPVSAAKDKPKPVRANAAPKSASGPKRVQGKKPAKTIGARRGSEETVQPISFIQPIIFFASLTTTTERYANVLLEDLRAAARDQADPQNRERGLLPPQIHDLSYIDFDDFFITAPKPPSTSPARATSTAF
ncbi:flavodoxin and radical SAM domain protein [Penicillium capsulatum]|uniref:Flavodoxin and radical SAM domain protein n=1 Tax=Penicillium capsulatum TaxID=69766 RepID=A0A9W9IS04_9EURO|nr:flavodoxin and radical SAM domain protein [Penicillium capsulatum]